MDKLGSLKWFIFGALSIILAILSMIWTPYDLLLEERLRMRPGVFTYDTPDVVRMKLYLFNITNADRFLNGSDKRLRLQEVGPIILREIWNHSDVKFNENSTMTYTIRRTPVYDPSLNNIDLNATLVYPNLPVLLSVSHLWDANLFVKITLNYIFDKLKSKTIVKKTIYEVLYNNTDPFLDLAHSLLPSIAAAKNSGLVPMIYDGGGDRITMFIGPKYGHQRFSLVDNFNGSTYIPRQGSKCKDNITDASEISLYSQLVPKERIIKYFKKFLCRAVPLVYTDEVYRQGIKTYRFTLSKDAYNRKMPASDDCYKGEPSLPDGLTDMSPCWFNYPIVGSFPHFLYGDPQLQNYVDGLTPDIKKHLPYGCIDPTTGISFDSQAMLQTNMHIRPLSGFHEMFDKFSNTVIPMFYASVGNTYLPDYIVNLVKFMNLAPSIDDIITVLLFLFGLYCVWIFFNKNKREGKIFSKNPKEETGTNFFLKSVKSNMFKSKSTS